MRAEGRRIREAIRRVGTAVSGSSWRGRDSERFVTTWAHHARVIDSVGGQLEDAAGEVDRNVAEQLDASAAGGTMPGPGTPGEASAEPSNGPQATEGTYVIVGGVLNYVPSRKPDQLDRRVDPGSPPIGDPIPLRTEVWEIGGGVAGGLGISGTARMLVSKLPGGRSMVSISDVDGATADTGISAEMALDGRHGVELGAGAHAELTKQTTQTWMVDSNEVPDLLWRLGLRELIGAGNLSPGIPFSTSGIERFVLGPALDVLGRSAPDPDVTDLVVGLTTSAEAAAAVGVPTFGVAGTALTSIGLRQHGETSSLLASGTGGYSTTAPGGGPSGDRTVEVEIPLAGTDDHQMIMTTTEVDGNRQYIRRSIYSLDYRAGKALKGAVGAVESGDPMGAAKAVHELYDGLEVDPIWTDTAVGEVNDDIHSADLGAALGPEISSSLTGGRRVVEYRG